MRLIAPMWLAALEDVDTVRCLPILTSTVVALLKPTCTQGHRRHRGYGARTGHVRALAAGSHLRAIPKDHSTQGLLARIRSAGTFKDESRKTR